MTDVQPWRLSHDDSEDLGFALTCLSSGAVTLKEFFDWIYLVLEQTDDYPDYLITLLDAKNKQDITLGWRDMIGFWPSFELSSAEDKALTGIAYTRFEDYRHDTVTRGQAAAALQTAGDLKDRFARSFPAISIPVVEVGKETAQERRVSVWWLVGEEGRQLTVSEVRALFIKRLASGPLTTILESDAGLTLRLKTDRQRVSVTLLSAGVETGHATGTEGQDSVDIPAALDLLTYIFSRGTAPREDWHTDV